ncbi:hypothetical protein PMIN03_012832, partial [Paraphaeosphaeria minitans]
MLNRVTYILDTLCLAPPKLKPNRDLTITGNKPPASGSGMMGLATKNMTGVAVRMACIVCVSGYGRAWDGAAPRDKTSRLSVLQPYWKLCQQLWSGLLERGAWPEDGEVLSKCMLQSDLFRSSAKRKTAFLCQVGHVAERVFNFAREQDLPNASLEDC